MTLAFLGVSCCRCKCLWAPWQAIPQSRTKRRVQWEHVLEKCGFVTSYWQVERRARVALHAPARTHYCDAWYSRNTSQVPTLTHRSLHQYVWPQRFPGFWESHRDSLPGKKQYAVCFLGDHRGREERCLEVEFVVLTRRWSLVNANVWIAARWEDAREGGWWLDHVNRLCPSP